MKKIKLLIAGLSATALLGGVAINGVLFHGGATGVSMIKATARELYTISLGSTCPSGWTYSKTSGHATGYLKLQKGDYVDGSLKTLLGDDESLNPGSDLSVVVSCGTFGNWSTKSAEITVALLDSEGTSQASKSSTFTSLTSSESAEKSAIVLTVPQAAVTTIRITISNLGTSGATLRFKNVKLTGELTSEAETGGDAGGESGANEGIYELSFKGNGTSDATTELKTDTFKSALNQSSTKLAFSSMAKVFSGKENTLRFGSSSASGSLTIDMPSSESAGLAILEARKFDVHNSTTKELTGYDSAQFVIGTAATVLAETFAYYPVELASLSSFTVSSSPDSKGRFYCRQLIVLEAGSTQNIELYKFAVTVLNETAAGCEAKNVTSTVWSSLSTAYSALSAEAKTALKNGVSKANGTLVEKALARYDVIVDNYSSHQNFIDRVTTSNAKLVDSLGSSSDTIALAAVAATTGIVAGAGLLFYRKKKHIA